MHAVHTDLISKGGISPGCRLFSDIAMANSKFVEFPKSSPNLLQTFSKRSSFLLNVIYVRQTFS